MAGKIFVRRRARLIASACAAAALVSVGAVGGGGARAGHVVDVRAVTLNGNPVANPKHVNVAAVGDIVRMDVFSQIRGVNGVKDERVWNAFGSFLSASGIKGNLAADVVAPFDTGGVPPYLPYDGAVVDLDGDGDLDVGQNGANNPLVVFRAASVSGGVETTTVVDADTSEIKIGELSFTVSNLIGAGPTSVNFRPTMIGASPFYSGAFWWEDGGTTFAQLKNATNSSFAPGPPVVITVPEIASAAAAPATLAATLGLAGRRRRRC